MTVPPAVALFAAPGVSRSTRLHTRLRWWWCPLGAVDAAVPAVGDVLEVGCGHGLVALHLALSSPARSVTGVDIDEAKIVEAVAASGRLTPGTASVRFEAVAAGYRPGPGDAWDAVVMVDVLYLLAEADQRELVEAAAATIRPGGAVVLKEMALEPRWKLAWNRFQETLATKVFRITESVGAGLTFVPPVEMAGWLAGAGLDVETRRVDRGYPWPHHLVIGRRP